MQVAVAIAPFYLADEFERLLPTTAIGCIQADLSSRGHDVRVHDLRCCAGRQGGSSTGRQGGSSDKGRLCQLPPVRPLRPPPPGSRHRPAPPLMLTTPSERRTENVRDSHRERAPGRDRQGQCLTRPEVGPPATI
jgi:hypothetical protein